MAAPLTFGPIYCEDAIALSSFPIEPVNTVSNLVIIGFGAAALWYISKRASRHNDLYVLGSLLLATGIGSLLWHGLREPWALAFDVLPGLFFLFGFCFCWARRLWSFGTAVSAMAIFIAAFAGSGFLFPQAPRFVSIAPAVIVAAFILIRQTALYSREAALWGTGALAGTLTALVFRTFDMEACAFIPVGTHFLWHIFNSAGAFMGIVALVTLQEAESRRPIPAAAQ
jgi:hypothetical protein